MTEKEFLYRYCLNHIQERIGRLKDEISHAQLSANEETKSSAGDKYETGRAMAQLDIERLMVQLREAEKINSTLQDIRSKPSPTGIIPGSLVTTTRGKFYIAISLGAVRVREEDYFIISADSPIGKLMIGRKVGEKFKSQGNDFEIQKIE